MRTRKKIIRKIANDVQMSPVDLTVKKLYNTAGI